MVSWELQLERVSEINISANVEKLKKDTDEAISKINNDSDKLENDRRIQEEQQRKERFDQIQTEVHESYAKNIGIEFKW